MLAQTNLQLYQQMLAAGWRDEGLARARSAYDLARGLFGNAFRPSHKSFLSHLVGTASAALSWDAAEPMVLAGLIHSAYLYGDFGDGERGTTPRRRRFVAEVVGTDAETLVYRYSHDRYATDPQVRRLRLADALDELGDGGPLVARGKNIGGLEAARKARQDCLDEAERLVGPIAAERFRAAFEELDKLTVPPALTTTDRAFHRVQPGQLAISRSVIARRWARTVESITKRRAA